MKYIKYLTRYFKWTFVAYFVFFFTTAALIPINADAEPETFPSTVPAEIGLSREFDVRPECVFDTRVDQISFYGAFIGEKVPKELVNRKGLITINGHSQDTSIYLLNDTKIEWNKTSGKVMSIEVNPKSEIVLVNLFRNRLEKASNIEKMFGKCRNFSQYNSDGMLAFSYDYPSLGITFSWRKFDDEEHPIFHLNLSKPMIFDVDLKTLKSQEEEQARKK